MSACFVVCGFLLGVVATKTSIAEPVWAVLIVPAGAALLAGLMEQRTR